MLCGLAGGIVCNAKAQSFQTLVRSGIRFHVRRAKRCFYGRLKDHPARQGRQVVSLLQLLF